MWTTAEVTLGGGTNADRLTLSAIFGVARHCAATEWFYDPAAIRYGYTSMAIAPGLWGGFSHYLYLPLNAVLHEVPDDGDLGVACCLGARSG